MQTGGKRLMGTKQLFGLLNGDREVRGKKRACQGIRDPCFLGSLDFIPHIKT
jgi:hypothetical protein